MTEVGLSGRIALVTGASRGLGRAVAQALGARGAKVVALARTVGGLEELDDAIRAAGGPPAALVPLDLTDGDGLERLGPAIAAREGRLDLVVHAAAEGFSLTPVVHLRPKDLARAFDVNVAATARLLATVAPLLAASDDPRLGYVTDPAAGRAHRGAYGATKAAAAALVASFAAETPRARVRLLEGRPMPTALRARTHPGEDRARLAPVSAEAERLLAELLA